MYSTDSTEFAHVGSNGRAGPDRVGYLQGLLRPPTYDFDGDKLQGKK